MIRVITIAREFASGGGIVGRLLADRLGWRLLDRELVAEIARAVNVQTELAAEFDEKVDPWIHRLAKHAFRHGTLERPAPLAEAEVFDSETMLEIGTHLIEEAARMGGCVVVGAEGNVSCTALRAYFTYSSTLPCGFAWRAPRLRWETARTWKNAFARRTASAPWACATISARNGAIPICTT